MDPKPSCIIAQQHMAEFFAIRGGLMKSLRRALEAQPGGLFRAALCGALAAPAGVLNDSYTQNGTCRTVCSLPTRVSLQQAEGCTRGWAQGRLITSAQRWMIWGGAVAGATCR